MKPVHRSRPIALAGVLFLLLAATSGAQDDFASRFKQAKAANDPKRTGEVLAEWKHARPDDPEHDLAAANDLLDKNTRLRIMQQAVPWTIDGERSPEALQQAIGLLKEAVSKAPSRIDIRLEIASLYEEEGEAAAVVKELTELVAYAKAHPSGLLDTDGKPFPEPVDEKLAYTISAFAGRYFEHETEWGNQAFLELAKLDLSAYPNREYGYNLMGNYYCTIDKNLKLALENYERALKFNPEDSLVLDNIGIVHLLAGEKKEAISALEKVVALNNDPEYVEKAKRQLARLK